MRISDWSSDVCSSDLEAVRTRQIEQLQDAAGWRQHATFLSFCLDASVFGDFLAAASQLIEQRGLAAVRIADQRNAQGCDAHVDSGVTCTRAASARRSAKRV